MQGIATLTLLVLVALSGVHANIVATQFLEKARKGVHDVHGVLRGVSVRGRSMHAQDSACDAFMSELEETCGEWFNSLKSPSLNFDSFCNNSCWTTFIMENNTLCYDTETKSKISLLKPMCARRGPDDARCGTVLMRLTDDECTQYGTSSSCNNATEYECEWSDGHCSRAVTNNFLRGVCSLCLGDILKAMAALINASDANSGHNGEGGGGGLFDVGSGVLETFQNLLCVRQDGVFCQVAVGPVFKNLTEGDKDALTTASLNGVCNNNTVKVCLRKIIPAVATMTQASALDNVRSCAMQFASAGSANDFQNHVTDACLQCYKNDIKQVRQMQDMADGLCTKNGDGAYCLTISSAEPGDAVKTCIQTIVSSDTSTCSASCNSQLSDFVDTYGCCLNGLVRGLNESSFVTLADLAAFWAVANSVRSGSHGNSEQSLPPVSSGAACDAGEGFDVDFSKLTKCASLQNIVAVINAPCAYARAERKVTRALSLKLNCTAVLATEEIRNAIVSAIVRDIAQALGLPVDAITGVLFVCPIDASAHHFAVLSGTPATLQFVIQSDNAAATDAAAAQLDSALSTGSLTFPALTSTVDAVCTTCATPADLANLASAASPVPTPAPAPPSTSTASSVRVIVALAALLIATIFSL